MTLDDLRSQKRQAIMAIAALRGVNEIRVFGSFARGEGREDSDLDLLIRPGPVRTPFFPGGFISDLEEALGRRSEATTRAALHPYLLQDAVLRNLQVPGESAGRINAVNQALEPGVPWKQVRAFRNIDYSPCQRLPQ